MRRLVVPGLALAALVPMGAAAATSPPDSPPPGTDVATSAPGTAPATEPAPTSGAPGSDPTETSAPAGTGAPADTTAGSEPAGSDPTAGGVATVYDEEGNPLAEITVTATEPGFTDYAEDNAPDEGNEYVRVTATVSGLAADEAFTISIDDFILQNSYGFVTTAENVPTAAQAEAEEEITTEAELASGESIDLTLTFEVDSSAGPQSVFYRPGEEQLVDIAEIA